jgi:hypothetical protein
LSDRGGNCSGAERSEEGEDGGRDAHFDGRWLIEVVKRRWHSKITEILMRIGVRDKAED